MILTVALNPAVDITYEVPCFEVGATNRVDVVGSCAGGKAVNVARILACLGQRCEVLGFATPDAATQCSERELSGAGLSQHWIRVPGGARRTVTIWERATDTATVFCEPGPAVAPRAWIRLRRAFDERVGHAAAVVLSGSLPVGVPDDAYAELAAVARAAGALVVVDTDGRGLMPAVTARPDIVKPNRHELAGVGGESPEAAVERLRALGAAAVVASFGAHGLLGSTSHGRWRVHVPRATGNPTGAGDACVAGLVTATLRGDAWPERLRFAAALGAAAVEQPTAGTVDLGDLDRLHAMAAVERVDQAT